MTVVRFGWLGTTRRQVIVERLDRVLAAWFAEWSMSAVGAPPGAQVETEWPHGTHLSAIRCARSLAGLSACHVRGARLGAFGRWLMDLHEDDGVGLADALAAEALADLSKRIHVDAAGSDSVALSDVDGNEAPDAFRAWAGALHAEIRLGRVDIDVLLDRDLCARIAPPPSVPRHALASRAHALSDTRLRVDATLDFGGASLADLSGLQVGELLVSDVPLTRFATLAAGGGKPLASGHLSRAGAAIALRLQPPRE